MSYCRFSSDNHMCDVYAFEHVYGGYVTHVAGNRLRLTPIPQLPTPQGRWQKRFIWWLWFRSRALHHWSVMQWPREVINHPAAGKSFTDETAAECADRLVALRKEGFRVPQYAIDALRSEVTS